MKKLLTGILMMVVLSGCGAHGWNHNTFINGIDVKRIKETKTLPFVAGIFSAMAIHEGGHLLALKMTGAKDISYEPPLYIHYNASDMTTGEMQWVSRAGFIAENGAGSLMLFNKKLRKSSFLLGFNAGAAAQTVLYPLPPGNTIDIYELQKHGGKAWFEYGAYSAWSLTNLYMTIKKTDETDKEVQKDDVTQLDFSNGLFPRDPVLSDLRHSDR